MNGKICWWRYPLAVLAFIVVSVVAPLIAFIALSLTELITPEYYRAGETWLWLVAYIAGAYMGYDVAFKISKGKDGFSTALSIFYAIYTIIVGTMNSTGWGYLPNGTAAYILSGIAIIGFHVVRLLRKNKSQEKENGAESNGHNS